MKNFSFFILNNKSIVRHSLKPIPRCLLAHVQSDGQTRIRYIPEFLELCRDCCDTGNIELREKEKGLFNEFVRKDRYEHTRKKICCENIIFSKKSF